MVSEKTRERTKHSLPGPLYLALDEVRDSRTELARIQVDFEGTHLLAASLIPSPVFFVAFFTPFAESLATTLVPWPASLTPDFDACPTFFPTCFTTFPVLVA